MHYLSNFLFRRKGCCMLKKLYLCAVMFAYARTMVRDVGREVW